MNSSLIYTNNIIIINYNNIIIINYNNNIIINYNNIIIINYNNIIIINYNIIIINYNNIIIINYNNIIIINSSKFKNDKQYYDHSKKSIRKLLICLINQYEDLLSFKCNLLTDDFLKQVGLEPLLTKGQQLVKILLLLLL